MNPLFPVEPTLNLLEKLYGVKGRVTVEKLLAAGGSWREVQVAVAESYRDADAGELAVQAAEKLHLFIPEGIRRADMVQHYLMLYSTLPDDLWLVLERHYSQLSDAECEDQAFTLYDAHNLRFEHDKLRRLLDSPQF